MCQIKILKFFDFPLWFFNLYIFHMLGFCPLGSGSKGNCIYVGTKETKILIDAGLSAKTIAARLAEIGVDIKDIEAVLVTHEHTDHILGLQKLACKESLPVFANSETAKGIYSALQECPKFKIFSTGETFSFGDIEIRPFSISHDALDPVAFTLRTENLKLGFCTDLGFVTTLVMKELELCDYLYIEANHQPEMVHASARPHIYKQRVLSRMGHLSNAECAELLAHLAHPALKHVHLAHLSSECNNPALALKIIQEKLQTTGHTIPVSIAHQDKVSRPVYF